MPTKEMSIEKLIALAAAIIAVAIIIGAIIVRPKSYRYKALGHKVLDAETGIVYPLGTGEDPFKKRDRQ
jgi:membrane protein YdbS with pleckstrin-like domain